MEVCEAVAGVSIAFQLRTKEIVCHAYIAMRFTVPDCLDESVTVKFCWYELVGVNVVILILEVLFGN